VRVLMGPELLCRMVPEVSKKFLPEVRVLRGAVCRLCQQKKAVASTVVLQAAD